MSGGACVALPERALGILLHPTSLPGSGENGALGAATLRYLNFLEACGARVWQLLPVGPVDGGGSPYVSASAHAGDERLLDPADPPPESEAALSGARQDAYERFVDGAGHWLHDFALFAVIRSAAQNLSAGVVQERDQARRYGDLIEAEGRRLTDMVEQVLEYAGLSGQRGPRLSRVPDVGHVVKDAVTSCESLIASEGFEVETNVAADLPPVLADEDAIRRAPPRLQADRLRQKQIHVERQMPPVLLGRAGRQNHHLLHGNCFVHLGPRQPVIAILGRRIRHVALLEGE